MTVRELLSRIDSAELTEWMAFDRVHTPTSWHQTALLCCIMANSWSAKRKFRVEDFLPRRMGRSRALLPNEGLKGAMTGFRNAMGRALRPGNGGQQVPHDPRAR